MMMVPVVVPALLFSAAVAAHASAYRTTATTVAFVSPWPITTATGGDDDDRVYAFPALTQAPRWYRYPSDNRLEQP